MQQLSVEFEPALKLVHEQYLFIFQFVLEKLYTHCTKIKVALLIREKKDTNSVV